MPQGLDRMQTQESVLLGWNKGFFSHLMNRAIPPLAYVSNQGKIPQSICQSHACESISSVPNVSLFL